MTAFITNKGLNIDIQEVDDGYLFSFEHEIPIEVGKIIYIYIDDVIVGINKPKAYRSGKTNTIKAYKGHIRMSMDQTKDWEAFSIEVLNIKKNGGINKYYDKFLGEEHDKGNEIKKGGN